MAGSIQEILSTKITTRVVSRVAGATSEVLNLFGMQPGGRNVFRRPDVHRTFGYDIFNDTRTVGVGRAPGAPAGVARRQKVGRVDATIPRMNEKLPLLLEELHNLRVVGGPANEYDEMGRAYIARQQNYMGQRAANFRKVLVGGMMRGKVYAHENGDDIYWNYSISGAMYTLDYQIPAGNLNQLDMLGDGDIIDQSWGDPTTDIPLHLSKINAGFQKNVGTRMDLAICDSEMWNRITNNEYVISKAGTSNTPFTVFERAAGNNENGLPNTTMRARLAAFPMLEWLVTDEGVELGTQGSESYTQFVGANNVWFGPNPTQGMQVMELVEGNEPVKESYQSNPVPRTGLHAWTFESVDPPVVYLYALDNALPCLYVPAATAYPTVVF